MQMKINKHAVSKEAELETAIRDAYPKVYSYLYHRTLDAALSKDLTQETFYRFYRHLDQYEEQGKLLNFLYRIARHLVYDHTRSRRYTDELQEEQSRTRISIDIAYAGDPVHCCECFYEYYCAPQELEAVCVKHGFRVLEVVDGERFCAPGPESQRLLFVAEKEIQCQS